MQIIYRNRFMHGREGFTGYSTRRPRRFGKILPHEIFSVMPGGLRHAKRLCLDGAKVFSNCCENNWLRRFFYFIGAPRRWTRAV